jgi:prepilin-type N-terminal cleavage/methylation domain-containing protein
MRGFSLIELSIVLVILGLLAGGILAGKSLIHAGELRRVSTDFSRYETAIHAFRDRYAYLPGDIPTASKIWGAGDGGTGNTLACYNTMLTGTATCNGNGDGAIVGSAPSNLAHEIHHAWQHLANAGLIEGQYSGAGIGDGTGYTWYTLPRVNAPPSPLSAQDCYWMQTFADGVTYFIDPPALIIALVGYDSGSASCYNKSTAMIPSDAWHIDTKIDDGRPAYGKVISPINTSCVTSVTSSLAQYKVTSDTKSCGIGKIIEN